MNHHLTPDEIIRMADDELANGERSVARQHLSNCARCRREVEFQKSLRQSAADTLPMTVSRTFTESVLRAVGVQSPKRLSDRISDHLGSVFALLMVIGMFGLVSSYVSSVGRSEGASTTGVWGQFGQQAIDAGGRLLTLLPQLAKPIKLPVSGDSGTLWMPVAVAFVLLIGVDMLLGRIYRIQRRRRT